MIVVAVTIVFSTNQNSPPGIQDSMEMSDSMIIQQNSEKTGTVETSEKEKIGEQSTNIEK